jgi:hypothetical protein
MTFCARPPIQARPRLSRPWRPMHDEIGAASRGRSQQFLRGRGRHAPHAVAARWQIAGLQQRAGQCLRRLWPGSLGGRPRTPPAAAIRCRPPGRPPGPGSPRRRPAGRCRPARGAPHLRATRRQQHAAGACFSTLLTMSPTSRLASRPRRPRRRMTSRSACCGAASSHDLGGRVGAMAHRTSSAHPRRSARPATARAGRHAACRSGSASCGRHRLELGVADDRQHAGQRQPAVPGQGQCHGLGPAVEVGVLGGQQQAGEGRGSWSMPPAQPARCRQQQDGDLGQADATNAGRRAPGTAAPGQQAQDRTARQHGNAQQASDVTRCSRASQPQPWGDPVSSRKRPTGRFHSSGPAAGAAHAFGSRTHRPQS